MCVCVCVCVCIRVCLCLYPSPILPPPLADDVLTEQAILKWYSDSHVAKGKSVFLAQMKKIVEWLQTAEEETEEEGEEEKGTAHS